MIWIASFIAISLLNPRSALYLADDIVCDSEGILSFTTSRFDGKSNTLAMIVSVEKPSTT
jgi:hypothetical protein